MFRLIIEKFTPELNGKPERERETRPFVFVYLRVKREHEFLVTDKNRFVVWVKCKFFVARGRFEYLDFIEPFRQGFSNRFKCFFA